MTARLAFTTATLAALTLAAALPASAQPTRTARLRSAGYDQGYTRGVDAGRDDARRNRANQYIDDLAYRDAEAGYRGEYGPRDRYRDDFRRGYAAGYVEGYRSTSSSGYLPDRGYPGVPQARAGGRGRSWGGPPGTRGGAPPPWYYDTRPGQRVDLAFENGYLDGYDAGLDDGADRRRFNPVDEGRYRSADHGYDRGYGPRGVYRNRYRDAFKQGYQAGYEDGRRYGKSRPWWWPW